MKEVEMYVCMYGLYYVICMVYIITVQKKRFDSNK